MTTQEKIILLLSKENLTNDENIFLLESFKIKPEFNKYKVIYNLLRDMKNNFHPNSNLISEYVLIKNGLPLEDMSNTKFIPIIEKHISNCSKCQEELELFNQEFKLINNFVSRKIEQIYTNKTNNVVKKPKNMFDLFKTNYVYSAAAVIAFFTLSLFSISEIITPSYKNISELSELTEYSSTRGRISYNFSNGIKALNDKNYNNAIIFLKNDIKNNSNDETIFYTNYMLGLTYLKKSESNFLGLFNSYNLTDIDSSIANFKRTIHKNNSSLFLNITYNSYFFIGKAYLLNNNFDEAKINLQIVIDKKGSFLNEIKKLIEIIDYIQQ